MGGHGHPPENSVRALEEACKVPLCVCGGGARLSGPACPSGPHPWPVSRTFGMGRIPSLFVLYTVAQMSHSLSKYCQGDSFYDFPLPFSTKLFINSSYKGPMQK